MNESANIALTHEPDHSNNHDLLEGRAFLLGLAAIALIPVWAFKYFPTTDGGAHVANADALLQYFRPAGAAYRQYYELNHLPVPNSLGHFVLAILMSFLPPLVAEKCFISAYVLLLPLSVRYAAQGVRRSGGWLAVLAVPLSLNWIFHQGFYNFLISVSFFFFLLGYWLRRRETMNVKRAVMLGLLALLLYAGHLLSITLACAAIFILAVWFTAVDVWKRRIWTAHFSTTVAGEVNAETESTGIWPGIRSRLVLTFAGLLPAIALVFWFQHRGFAGKPGKMILGILKPEFWKNLFSLAMVVSYRSRVEKPLAMLLAFIFIALLSTFLVKKLLDRRWNSLDGLIFVPLAFVALYFTRGDFASGQLFIPQRLVFYIYLTSLLFLATQTFSLRIMRAIAILSVILVVSLTAAHWPAYREYNVQLNDFLETAERIEPQSTLLPLIFSPRGLPMVVDADGLRSMPFYSAAGYAAVAKHAVDLRNYEAGLDYFPVRFKAALNPYRHLAVMNGKQNGLEMVPQRIDLPKYMRQTQGRADYVLIWAVSDNLKNHPDTREIFRQLANDYQHVYTSSSGRSELWKLSQSQR